MPLIDCLACHRQISEHAAACPHCGHPNDQAAATGPKCYRCSAAATTRSQSCGAFSCAVHLQSIYIYHGKGGAYELRCDSCYESAQTWQMVGCIISIIGLIAFAIFFFTFFLPGWQRAGGFPAGQGADFSAPKQARQAPWQTTENGLTLSVDRVEIQGNNFRVFMTATNQTGDNLTLPLFGYFVVVDDRGNQYKADPFSSTFPREVPRGATVKGHANIEAPLNADATILKAGFTTVFGSFSVNSIVVDGIAIDRNKVAQPAGDGVEPDPKK